LLEYSDEKASELSSAIEKARSIFPNEAEFAIADVHKTLLTDGLQPALDKLTQSEQQFPNDPTIIVRKAMLLNQLVENNPDSAILFEKATLLAPMRADIRSKTADYYQRVNQEYANYHRGVFYTILGGAENAMQAKAAFSTAKVPTGKEIESKYFQACNKLMFPETQDKAVDELTALIKNNKYQFAYEKLIDYYLTQNKLDEAQKLVDKFCAEIGDPNESILTTLKRTIDRANLTDCLPESA